MKKYNSNISRSRVIPKYKRMFEDIAGIDTFSTIIESMLQDIVDEIALQGTYKTDTGNLVESIGAMFIVNGTPFGANGERNAYIYPRGHKTDTNISTPHKEWAKHDIPQKSGRQYLDEYFDDIANKSKGTHGFKIYVAAAAYYAQILEEGAQANPPAKGPLGRKYHVILFAKNRLLSLIDMVCMKYNSMYGGKFDMRKGSKYGGVRNLVREIALGTSYSM